jgi:hypothetical protein
MIKITISKIIIVILSPIKLKKKVWEKKIKARVVPHNHPNPNHQKKYKNFTHNWKLRSKNIKAKKLHHLLRICQEY